MNFVNQDVGANFMICQPASEEYVEGGDIRAKELVGKGDTVYGNDHQRT